MSSSAAASSASAQEAETRSNSNDLIIDEGFPVLNTFRRPKPGDKSNELSQKDPVPRYPFAAFPSALLIEENQMENIIHDCDLAFTARTKEDSDAYSSGATYFMPASMKPRCALEELAMNIFKSHTKGLEPGKHFDLERSGAEWWTLVLDTVKESKESNTDDDADANSLSSDEEDDEVGMHFDADYGLEAQLPNFMLHPRVATVTYLSNVGVPTLVLNKRAPPPADVEKKSLNGSIEQGWLSCPMVGKHICFDGRLLHGAPGAFFPASNTAIEKNTNVAEHSAKRRKLESGEKLDTDSSIHAGTKRITFMVNVWLNHCPIDAELIDDDLCTRMKTLWECNEKTGDGGPKGDANYKPPLQWALNDVSKSSHDISKEEIKLCDESDWAGTEECVICNREVDVNYCSSMNVLHTTAKKASDAEGKSIEISFEAKVLSLEVGAEVEDSDSEEEDGEEE